jgi:hypothetical protein
MLNFSPQKKKKKLKKKNQSMCKTMLKEIRESLGNIHEYFDMESS